MNYNILSYIIFGLMSIYIIVFIGRQFHQNGRIFILNLFNNNSTLTDTTNNLLLVAYYLFNIGYAIIQFSYWEIVSNYTQVLSSVTTKIGLLVLILAALHYNNMFVIYLLSKNKIKSITTKE